MDISLDDFVAEHGQVFAIECESCHGRICLAGDDNGQQVPEGNFRKLESVIQHG